MNQPSKYPPALRRTNAREGVKGSFYDRNPLIQRSRGAARQQIYGGASSVAPTVELR